jgi:hypothetical protein
MRWELIEISDEMGINTFSISGNCLDQPWDLLNIMLDHKPLVTSYDIVETAIRNSCIGKVG